MIRNKIKQCKLVIVSILLLTIGNGCDSYLEVEQFTKVNEDLLTASESGLQVLVANLYSAIPMEDFEYHPDGLSPYGFNMRGQGDNTFYWPSMWTDESIGGGGSNSIGPGQYNMWSSTNDNGNINGWARNREVNIFLKAIEKAKTKGSISEDSYNRLWSEAQFVRAYLYFAMVKRFGGVPIIDWLQDDDYTGDPKPLIIPRSTESDTWKFILKCCDNAAKYLPLPEDMKDGNPMWRASKWAAYALKSRAALYAASIAKFGNRVNFPASEAVNLKLVGIDASEANYFYGECLNASKAIIDGGHYSLYKPEPANPQEAAVNYQNLFMNGQDCGVEVIFGRTYVNGTTNAKQGHGWDQFNTPFQVTLGAIRTGRFSVTLDIVDLYEDYTDDGTGKSAPIVTRTDGIENQFINTNTPSSDQVISIPFVKYDNPYDAFKNKDARLLASVIVPNSQYKGTTIIMQGAMIRKNGVFDIYVRTNEEGKDGKMYYLFGGESNTQYSGFDGPMQNMWDAQYTSTGFSIRKYMGEDKTTTTSSNVSCTTPWLDFRLAEIYLNYAEAVIESGQGDATDATGYLNAIRRRAGHTDQIPLTVDLVQKERRVELFAENHRFWDLIRRREYHTLFNNYRRQSLVQTIDLREPVPKYVFLRIYNFHDIRLPKTFQVVDYYQSIPGIDINQCIQNPGH